MPALVYRHFFRAHSVKSLERNVLGFVGIAPVHETLIGMVDKLDAPAVQKWLDKLREHGPQGRPDQAIDRGETHARCRRHDVARPPSTARRPPKESTLLRRASTVAVAHTAFTAHRNLAELDLGLARCSSNDGRIGSGATRA